MVEIIVIILLVIYFAWLARYLYRKKKRSGNLTGCSSCEGCKYAACSSKDEE